MSDGAPRHCPHCATASVALRGAADRPLEAYCERVCERCGAVLGSYAGAAAARIVWLWSRPVA